MRGAVRIGHGSAHDIIVVAKLNAEIGLLQIIDFHIACVMFKFAFGKWPQFTRATKKVSIIFRLAPDIK